MAMTALCFVVLIVFFKEFKIATFDSAFGQSLGFPTKYLNALLTSVIVIAVVIGLHTVGVVLMVARLVEEPSPPPFLDVRLTFYWSVVAEEESLLSCDD